MGRVFASNISGFSCFKFNDIFSQYFLNRKSSHLGLTKQELTEFGDETVVSVETKSYNVCVLKMSFLVQLKIIFRSTVGFIFL